MILQAIDNSEACGMPVSYNPGLEGIVKSSFSPNQLHQSMQQCVATNTGGSMES
jgi:hypothetical protein